MTESNGVHEATPAPRILSRSLLIETTTDNDGVREVETREATEEEMGQLGWMRAKEASDLMTAIAQDGQRQMGAMALAAAANGGAIPDLEANWHGVKAPLEYDLSVTPQRGKLPSEWLADRWPGVSGDVHGSAQAALRIALRVVGELLDERLGRG